MYVFIYLSILTFSIMVYHLMSFLYFCSLYVPCLVVRCRAVPSHGRLTDLSTPQPQTEDVSRFIAALGGRVRDEGAGVRGLGLAGGLARGGFGDAGEGWCLVGISFGE